MFSPDSLEHLQWHKERFTLLNLVSHAWNTINWMFILMYIWSKKINFLEEMISDIVNWPKCDTFCLINKMNYVTTWPKSIIIAQVYENNGQPFLDLVKFKTSDNYMFIAY